MRDNWTDVGYEPGNYYFWKRQWTKHGSCASNHKDLNSVVKYFNKGFDLLKKYQMKNILRQLEFIPGNSLPIEQISTKLSQHLGKRTHITWFKNEVIDL